MKRDTVTLGIKNTQESIVSSARDNHSVQKKNTQHILEYCTECFIGALNTHIHSVQTVRTVPSASVQLMSSSPFSLHGVASPPANIATSSCRVTLLSNGSKTTSMYPVHLSTTLCPIASPSQAKIEALNLHHRYWSSSLNNPTLILYYYKNIISILIILSIT
jgi:hypothetical protein